MIPILFWLFASTIFASIPGCFFGNQGQFYTLETSTFDQYEMACLSSFGETTEVYPETTDEESLITWLHLRRGLRACNITRAFAYNANFKKSANGPRGCCVISPGGIKCSLSCPENLSIPALCMQLG